MIHAPKHLPDPQTLLDFKRDTQARALAIKIRREIVRVFEYLPPEVFLSAAREQNPEGPNLQAMKNLRETTFQELLEVTRLGTTLIEASGRAHTRQFSKGQK